MVVTIALHSSPPDTPEGAWVVVGIDVVADIELSGRMGPRVGVVFIPLVLELVTVDDLDEDMGTAEEA
jgi:hypothetical protein